MFLKLLNIALWFALVTSVTTATVCGIMSGIEWLGLHHFESIEHIRSSFSTFTQYGINMMVGVLWIKYRNTVEVGE